MNDLPVQYQLRWKCRKRHLPERYNNTQYPTTMAERNDIRGSAQGGAPGNPGQGKQAGQGEQGRKEGGADGTGQLGQQGGYKQDQPGAGKESDRQGLRNEGSWQQGDRKEGAYKQGQPANQQGERDEEAARDEDAADRKRNDAERTTGTKDNNAMSQEAEAEG